MEPGSVEGGFMTSFSTMRSTREVLWAGETAREVDALVEGTLVFGTSKFVDLDEA